MPMPSLLQKHPSGGAHSRSQSDASISVPMKRPRPGSAHSMSTTSEHSVGPSYQPEQMSVHQSYMAQTDPSAQRMFQSGPEEVLMAYGAQIAQNQPIDPNLPPAHHYEMRPVSQQGYQNQDMTHFPIMQGYPHGMPQYGMPQEALQHPHAQTRNFEGAENQSPAPDDSENPEPGTKKKKGAATSLANDAELRRLLQQYQGKKLKEVAVEIQRKEGGEGKSEKAKQVFAMLWLQENCKRSTNSVRRDRVFSRYTERCGNERVPTLNPASFGKLVRIIFPNVQTRRLGVRGESKYHYVDLSLFPEDDERQQPLYNMVPVNTGDATTDMHSSMQNVGGVYHSRSRSVSVPQPILSQPPTETADFPLPSKSFAPRPIDQTETTHIASQPFPVPSNYAPKMDCHYLNTPLIRMRSHNMSTTLVSALPAVRSSLPATLSSYLGLPTPASHTSSLPPNSQTDSPIDLPDIHYYLAGTNYDRDVANSLSHLYRSYCIIVIDSFRYVREKPFFHHHSAFNGTMTVPVSKLLASERLAPWIQECDMRMYKKMIRYISPLVTQVVPDRVWNMFENVSNKLIPHLVGAFEEKCPTHVVVAKLVPAARFCQLLKKLRAANTAANHAGTMLFEERGRSQMWIDLMTCVDPGRVVEESMPPPDCWNSVEGVIGHDIKHCIAATNEEFVNAVEQDPLNAFAAFVATTKNSNFKGVLEQVTENEDAPVSPLDRWIQWLERLHQAFPKHSAQCLINWHNGFWKSIMTQLGTGGASTYQAWWYLEAFLNNMLGWLTQMEGLLMHEMEQKDFEARESEKKRQDEYMEMTDRRSLDIAGRDQDIKRKRSLEDTGGEERSGSRTSSTSGQSSNTDDGASRPQTAMTNATTGLDGSADDQDDLDDELRNGGPLDLPSIDTSSPQKRQHQAHDDSGISLDVDIEGNGGSTEDHLKRLKREWGILSDPADADGHVVVV